MSVEKSTSKENLWPMFQNFLRKLDKPPEGESFLLSLFFFFFCFVHLGSAYFPAPMKPQVTISSRPGELHCSQLGENKRSPDFTCKLCRGPLLGTMSIIDVTTCLGVLLSRRARIRLWQDLNACSPARGWKSNSRCSVFIIRVPRSRGRMRRASNGQIFCL